VTVHQDAAVYASVLEAGQAVSHRLRHEPEVSVRAVDDGAEVLLVETRAVDRGVATSRGAA
jgi:hypothetical protein